MKITFFKSQSKLRKWFLKNHDKSTENYIGFYKKDSGKNGITYPEALDEALCFGWIDGVRKTVDTESYMIRFTPRKKGSIWSAVNIAKINELMQNGKIHESGLKTYKERDLKRQKKYSYENEPEGLSKKLKVIFKCNKKAWEYFSIQSLSYRRKVSYWVMSAVKDETRLKRLKELIDVSAKGENHRFIRKSPNVKCCKPRVLFTG